MENLARRQKEQQAEIACILHTKLLEKSLCNQKKAQAKPKRAPAVNRRGQSGQTDRALQRGHLLPSGEDSLARLTQHHREGTCYHQERTVWPD